MKKLILIPKIFDTDRIPGGVENYYKVLRFDQEEGIDYFASNANSDQEGRVAFVLRILNRYWSYLFLLLRNHYNRVLLNPSLDNRSFYRDAVFIGIAHAFGIKTLVFFRSWHNEFEEKVRHRRLEAFLFRVTYAKCHKFVVLGSVFRDKLISMGVNGDRVVIESTLANDDFLSKLSINDKIASFDKKLTVLFLARVKPGKGIFLALDAFREFQQKNGDRDAEFVVAGDGPELEEAQRYVQEKNVRNVVFHGFVSGAQKEEVLLKANVLLFPTNYDREGLPNAILEGMLYGLPIVSRIHVGIPDVVTHGVNGFLSDSLEHLPYASFLEKIASDKGLYTSMVHANHDKALHNYTKHQVKKRIVSLLNA